MELYEHNQVAYQEADKMLKTYGRAAVIHPTGTGKSFIAFKLIEEHPDAQFLWLSPNDYIFESQRRNVSGNFNNVVHMTYTRLIRMNEEELNLLCSEYIILDEFHRCGAYCWGTGVERLLKNCPVQKFWDCPQRRFGIWIIAETWRKNFLPSRESFVLPVK